MLLVAGVLTAFAWQSGAAPEHWQAHENFLAETSPQQLESLAWEVERRLPGQWTHPIGAGNGVRELTVTFDELNAWLAVRLDDYLANQGTEWPAGVSGLMLAGQEGQLLLAGKYDSPRWGDRVISIFLQFVNGSEPLAATPRASDDPIVATGPQAAVRVSLMGARLGRQGLPRSMVIGALAQWPAAHDAVGQAHLDAWRVGEAVPLPPLPVDSSREAVIENIRVEAEGIVLRARARFISSD